MHMHLCGHLGTPLTRKELRTLCNVLLVLFPSVTISFENYKSAHPAFRDDQDDDTYDIEEQKSPWGKYRDRIGFTYI